MQRRCPAFWLVSATVILNTAKIRQPLNANVIKEIMYYPFQVISEFTRTSLSPHYTRFCCVNTTGWSVLWRNSTLTGKGRDSTRRHARSWEDTSRFEMGSVPCYHNVGVMASHSSVNYVLFVCQVLTFRDFLHHIVGPEFIAKQLSTYPGYDEDIDPSISNVFATAAFRFAHLMVQPFIFRLDKEYKEHPDYRTVLLHTAFFAPWRVIFEGLLGITLVSTSRNK